MTKVSLVNRAVRACKWFPTQHPRQSPSRPCWPRVPFCGWNGGALTAAISSPGSPQRCWPSPLSRSWDLRPTWPHAFPCGLRAFAPFSGPRGIPTSGSGPPWRLPSDSRRSRMRFVLPGATGLDPTASPVPDAAFLRRRHPEITDAASFRRRTRPRRTRRPARPARGVHSRPTRRWVFPASAF